MRELRLKTARGELAALQWGEPDAPPLLALHGWLDNAASFGAIAPRLAACRRVIAPDLPGHGHSAHLPAGAIRYHVVDQVDHVLDAADALGLASFDLLGHSLGAGIASLIAAALPARVGKLALIEGLGPLADDGSQTLSRWRDARWKPRTVSYGAAIRVGGSRRRCGSTRCSCGACWRASSHRRCCCWRNPKHPTCRARWWTRVPRRYGTSASNGCPASIICMSSIRVKSPNVCWDSWASNDARGFRPKSPAARFRRSAR